MTPQDIINETARIAGMPREDFTTPCRETKVCEVRHLAIWGIRKLKSRPKQSDVARMFGFSTLSNVGYAVRKADDLHETCPQFRRMRDELESIIKAREVAA